ncbi:hypothetical protein ACSHXN_41020 [Streptomyces sp. HUAS TT11]|uniref:hypothetical protein n=1 Tax=Streptomyces sp. HUAS TT11 TaxID=3447508 RepID=UPI003F65CB84
MVPARSWGVSGTQGDRPLAENQIVALWRLDVSLQEKMFCKMLYESAARAG